MTNIFTFFNSIFLFISIFISLKILTALLITVILQLIYLPSISAQEDTLQVDTVKYVLDHDTTYYKSYNNDLHLRLYSVYKYNNLILTGNNQDQSIVYSPNGNLNLGFGFNYRGLGVNIGINFPAINNDNDKFGETQKLDMRSYMYGRKVAIDFGLQFYHGFYISDYENSKINNTPSNQPSEVRGDMSINTMGITAMYVHNYEKFSFRAAFAQTEVQKKTAGSWLYGPYLNFLNIKADSSLIPIHIRDRYKLEDNIIEGFYGSVGILGGYALSVILFKRFFLTGAAALGYGLTYGNSWYESTNGRVNESIWDTGFKLNTRAALGYNTRRTYVGLSFVLESYNIATSYDITELYWMGQFRVNLVRRFDWKVPPLDWIMNKIPVLKNSGKVPSDK